MGREVVNVSRKYEDIIKRYYKDLNDDCRDYTGISQRDNKIDPNNTCGPTNFIQALVYSGWGLDELKGFGRRFGITNYRQPEDVLTYFCRTNNDVLNYYLETDKTDCNKWLDEAKTKPKGKIGDNFETYPPNEKHNIMSYAANIFCGVNPISAKKNENRTVCKFYGSWLEYDIIDQLYNGLPVVGSLKTSTSKGKIGGHYITIVGFTTKSGSFDFLKDYKGDAYKEKEVNRLIGTIDGYILDNTYGKFKSKYNKLPSGYLNVDGSNEIMERSLFINSLRKDAIHFFTKKN